MSTKDTPVKAEIPITSKPLSYEQQAEELAIRRLLEDKHFHNAVTIDSGHGYLYSLISQYADIMTLPGEGSGTEDISASTQLAYPDASVDLLIMVRYISCLADPEGFLQDVARVLSQDGIAIIEVANYAHLHRIKNHRHGRAKSKPSTGSDLIMNDPKKLIRNLAHAGLKVERILSVSSLQGTGFRKVMPNRVLLAVEGLLQPALGKRYYGPSVFLTVRKVTTHS